MRTLHRPTPLDRMGIGNNWVGCHVPTYLALHPQRMVAVSPVPLEHAREIGPVSKVEHSQAAAGAEYPERGVWPARCSRSKVSNRAASTWKAP